MARSDLLGAWGEVQAAEYLRKKRYQIVARNVRIRGGEIDLIAANRRYLVFVEVKTRRDSTFAQAREFVDARKQQRIKRTAEYWLCTAPDERQPRFDVLEVYAPAGTETKKPRIVHWENAFF